MHALSEEQFQSLAAPSLKNIFADLNPYGQPFAPHVAVRHILFEYWYVMEPPLLEAVILAASEQGDQGFYVSILDRPIGEMLQQVYHWYVPFSESNTYRSLIGPLPNVVYAPSGSWGILCSDEHHGLLGGSIACMSRLQALVPDIDRQVFAFLAAWRSNQRTFGSNIRWLPRLLEHIYGEATAQELLSSSHLS